MVLTSEGDPIPDPISVTALVFVREDGRWLLDESLDEYIWVEECNLSVSAGEVLGPPPGFTQDDLVPFDDPAVRCDFPDRDRIASAPATPYP